MGEDEIVLHLYDGAEGGVLEFFFRGLMVKSCNRRNMRSDISSFVHDKSNVVKGEWFRKGTQRRRKESRRIKFYITHPAQC